MSTDNGVFAFPDAAKADERVRRHHGYKAR